MASKLELYNDAMAHLGERPLASISEAREPRRKLDAVWDRAIRACLEQGLWNFALRTVQADSSADFDPTFGYTFAFEKPTDWIRTAVISANEQLTPPLLRYSDEADLWYADSDPLYVQYVSDDGSYGGDLSLWPETFGDFVAAHLARRICRGINSSTTDVQTLMAIERKFRIDARSKDAMNQAPGFPPQGSWVASRGRRTRYYNTDGRPR